MAEFSDKRGGLSPGIVGVGEILVPPVASVDVLSAEGGRTAESISYPVPLAWKERLPVSPLTAVVQSARGSRLEREGWRKKEGSDGLLKAIDAIAADTATAEDVRRFALRWGPLWLCARHSEGGFLCHWRFPNFDVDPPMEGTNVCEWSASESVEAFRRCARQVSRAFEAAMRLKDGRSITKPLADELDIHGLSPRLSLSSQRRAFARLVSNNLSLAGGPHLILTWEEGERPSLAFQIGLGFYRLAWLEIAQLISGATDVCSCSGCGTLYVRKGRRPAIGKNNYCLGCGRRAANRESARRRRKAVATKSN